MRDPRAGSLAKRALPAGSLSFRASPCASARRRVGGRESRGTEADRAVENRELKTREQIRDLGGADTRFKQAFPHHR